MKPCHTDDLNTVEFWDSFWTTTRGMYESHACPDVVWLLRLLTAGKEKTLDVGCGVGRYFPWFRSDEIHGIEISPKGVEQAQKQFPDAIVSVMDIVKDGILYPENTFDVVYCGEMLEHVSDTVMLVNDLRRVTKPGGVVVLNTPFEDSIPADAHLWFIYRKDLTNLFKDFTHTSIFRFSNSPDNLWEHFLVVGTK